MTINEFLEISSGFIIGLNNLEGNIGRKMGIKNLQKYFGSKEILNIESYGHEVIITIADE